MKKRLIFATNNQHKIEEIRQIMGNQYRIITLKEAGIDIDIPEPHDSLEANATGKSQAIYQLTRKDCFSEDTGLEVEALNGEPGVKSARYAGDNRDFQLNIDKLLQKMNSCQNRKARFRTVISLLLSGREYLFEGVCEGEITQQQKGTKGFGYDPVFIPSGSEKTFAEMTVEEKSECSHRKKATSKLIHFLQQQNYY